MVETETQIEVFFRNIPSNGFLIFAVKWEKKLR